MLICSKNKVAAWVVGENANPFLSIPVNALAGIAALGVEGRGGGPDQTAHGPRSICSQEGTGSEAKQKHPTTMIDPTAMSCKVEDGEMHRHTGPQRCGRWLLSDPGLPILALTAYRDSALGHLTCQLPMDIVSFVHLLLLIYSPKS
jgi:hypothetical protein